MKGSNRPDVALLNVDEVPIFFANYVDVDRFAKQSLREDTAGFRLFNHGYTPYNSHFEPNAFYFDYVARPKEWQLLDRGIDPRLFGIRSD